MTKEFTCIICPNGCQLKVQYDLYNNESKVSSVTGNLCPKGAYYGKQELEEPMRSISSSVSVIGGDIPLSSVRLNKPIPKEKIFEVMNIIKDVRINAPVHTGDVIIKNILGLNADLIATKNVAAIDT